MGNTVQKIERLEPEAVTPMRMLQIAIEKGADLDMMERLMTLQERYEANEARKAFVAALNAFKAEKITITKNRHAGFESKRTGDRTDYDYATLDQVCDAIAPALSKHGLAFRWEVAQEAMIRVTCILTHERGHSEHVMLQAGADQSGSKNSIQAIGSTITYLERYTLLAATGLATASYEDDDGHGSDRSPISAEQKAELIELMKETGADTRRFLDFMGVDSLDRLPASDFAEAKAKLLEKKAALGKKAGQP